MKHAPLKEGRKWGAWSSTSCSQSISLFLTMTPFLANMYRMYNLDKFLKLPISSRLSGMFCFPLVWPFGCHLFFPTICLKNILVHKEALTKFIQWYDSQQSLTLMTTGISLMKKSFPPKQECLYIITALQGSTYAIIQCCVFIADESANVSSLVNHILCHFTPSLEA